MSHYIPPDKARPHLAKDPRTRSPKCVRTRPVCARAHLLAQTLRLLHPLLLLFHLTALRGNLVLRRLGSPFQSALPHLWRGWVSGWVSGGWGRQQPQQQQQQPQQRGQHLQQLIRHVRQIFSKLLRRTGHDVSDVRERPELSAWGRVTRSYSKLLT